METGQNEGRKEGLRNLMMIMRMRMEMMEEWWTNTSAWWVKEVGLVNLKCTRRHPNDCYDTLRMMVRNIRMRKMMKVMLMISKTRCGVDLGIWIYLLYWTNGILAAWPWSKSMIIYMETNHCGKISSSKYKLRSHYDHPNTSKSSSMALQRKPSDLFGGHWTATGP